MAIISSSILLKEDLKIGSDPRVWGEIAGAVCLGGMGGWLGRSRGVVPKGAGGIFPVGKFDGGTLILGLNGLSESEGFIGSAMGLWTLNTSVRLFPKI